MGRTALDKDRDNKNNASMVSCFVFQTQNFILTLKYPKDGERGKRGTKEKHSTVFLLLISHT